MPGAFDGLGQLALVRRASACLPARADFAVLRNKSAQDAGVFVINGEAFVSAKLANARAGITLFLPLLTLLPLLALLIAAYRTSPLRLFFITHGYFSLMS